VPLFVRRKAGLQLTTAGRAYWAEVSPALRRIERATQDLVTNKGNGGTLNLSVASSFGTHWLIPRLSAFVASHPEITLNLSTHVGWLDLSSAPCDAAILYCEGPIGDLKGELVSPLVLRPYAAPQLVRKAGLSRRGGAFPMQALKRLLSSVPLIRLASEPQAWAGWLAAAAIDDVPAAQQSSGPEYDLLSMALNGTIAGQGIGLLPEYAAAGAIGTRQLEPLSDIGWQARKGYYFLYPGWKTDLVAVQRFQEWLRSA
jgi:LysR family glycine cleavage system transcriptional activator